jgi:hypothetical protein
MDYKKIYDDLMQSRLLMKEERIKSKKAGEYFEAHHIVPVCMGGVPVGKLKGYKFLLHDNIVLLTAKEHWISHALLYVIYKTPELALAFRLLSDIKKRDSMKEHILSSKLYEEARLASFKKKRNRPGKPHTEETRKKMSESHKGKKINISDSRRKELSDRMKANNIKRTETIDEFLSKPKIQMIVGLLNDGCSLNEIQIRLSCDRKLVIKVKKLAFKMMYDMCMSKCHTSITP